MANLTIILFLCAAVPMGPALYMLPDKRSRLFLGFMLLGLVVCLIASEFNTLLLWLVILELSIGKGVAANVGHEHLVICCKDGRFELMVYRHAPVVAALEGICFREHEFEFNTGDRLYVYTDGVPEAMNLQNELFGTEHMVAVLNRDPNAGPEALLRTVHDEIDAFVGDTPQFDDISMLGLYYRGRENKA